MSDPLEPQLPALPDRPEGSTGLEPVPSGRMAVSEVRDHLGRFVQENQGTPEGRARILAVLRPLASCENVLLRRSAMFHLPSVAPDHTQEALAILRAGLADPDAMVREWAGGMISAADATRPAATTDSVVELIVGQLGRLEQVRDWRAYCSAAKRLARLGPVAANAIPALEAMAARGWARKPATFALSQIRPEIPWHELMPRFPRRDDPSVPPATLAPDRGVP
jgi:hypothetical protein